MTLKRGLDILAMGLLLCTIAVIVLTVSLLINGIPASWR